MTTSVEVATPDVSPFSQTLLCRVRFEMFAYVRPVIRGTMISVKPRREPKWSIPTMQRVETCQQTRNGRESAGYDVVLGTVMTRKLWLFVGPPDGVSALSRYRLSEGYRVEKSAWKSEGQLHPRCMLFSPSAGITKYLSGGNETKHTLH